MGIHKLMTLIQEKAPKAVKTITLDYLTGKVIACDASMAIYQFLIATQTMKQGMGIGELRDDKGNLTGHLVGMFHRTIQFLENGIKPIWVFDGKPPDLKSKVLETRKEQKEKATEEKKAFLETGDLEGAKRMAGRSVKVTWDMMRDAKKLLRLMGCPVVEAPGEAEAQCAVIVKNGQAFATASEDMDALTFGTKVLLRGFNSKKEPIIQIELDEVLEGFNMNQDQFIDLCILCGCDYTTNITGVGPVKAYKYISEQGGVIENVLKKIEKENNYPWKKKKYHIPENFYYKEARELFKVPAAERDKKTIDGMLKWTKPDEEGLKEFLIQQKGFSEIKVDSGLKKLRGCQGKTNQARLDCFFNQGQKKTSNSFKKDEKNKGSACKENTNSHNNTYSKWYNDPFSIPGKQKPGSNPLAKKQS
ncbi:flap endonuclease 1-like [Stylonychia lemnae]|uniref:Flap endonuclease 1 n=1 Tax=Stylonychia lemnae TaxID=5949 RepID=A0A078AES0_STYLE|nr:flap endonuclease 1-like [Stylonychia lemnae]|eukprot:CDW80730.1 flap endonuclease 1-like [Stylonychia lemnae]